MRVTKHRFLPILLLLSLAGLAGAQTLPEGPYGEPYPSPEEIRRQDRQEHRRGIHLRKLIRGESSRPEVLLTFDDGPHPEYTLKLLNILDKHQVKATFFVIGKMVEKRPDLVRAIAERGHTLGNHSFTHRNLSRLSAKDIQQDLLMCHEAVETVTGGKVQMNVFRPPGGQYNKTVADVALSLGYTMILWTDDPGDYANPGDTVVETRTVDRLENGAVILLHDGSEDTLRVLDAILTRVKEDGLTPVSPRQMLREVEE